MAFGASGPARVALFHMGYDVDPLPPNETARSLPRCCVSRILRAHFLSTLLCLHPLRIPSSMPVSRPSQRAFSQVRILSIPFLVSWPTRQESQAELDESGRPAKKLWLGKPCGAPRAGLASRCEPAPCDSRTPLGRKRAGRRTTREKKKKGGWWYAWVGGGGGRGLIC